MIIQKTDLYKLLSAQTRGKANWQQWREFLNIYTDTIFDLINKGDIVRTPQGTFESRECKRKVSGFGVKPTVYETRREIKFTPSEKYKGLLND